jgi:hypothetical protein
LFSCMKRKDKLYKENRKIYPDEAYLYDSDDRQAATTPLASE